MNDEWRIENMDSLEKAKTKRIEDVPGYYATLSKGKAIRRLFKSIQRGKKNLSKK